MVEHGAMGWSLAWALVWTEMVLVVEGGTGTQAAGACGKDRLCNTYCDDFQDLSKEFSYLEPPAYLGDPNGKPKAKANLALPCKDSSFGPDVHVVYELRLSFITAQMDEYSRNPHSLCQETRVDMESVNNELIQLQLINNLDRLFQRTGTINSTTRCIDTPHYFSASYCYPGLQRQCIYDHYHYVAFSASPPPLDWVQGHLGLLLDSEAGPLQTILRARRAWRHVASPCPSLRTTAAQYKCQSPGDREYEAPPEGEYWLTLDVVSFDADLKCWEVSEKQEARGKFDPSKKVEGDDLVRGLLLRLLTRPGLGFNLICFQYTKGGPASHFLRIKPNKTVETEDQIKEAVANASMYKTIFKVIQVNGSTSLSSEPMSANSTATHPFSTTKPILYLFPITTFSILTIFLLYPI